MIRIFREAAALRVAGALRVAAALLFGAVAYLASGCGAGSSAPAAVPTAAPPPDATVHHEFLSLPGDPSREVELYWAAPPVESPSQAPWPAVVLVHGHQVGERPGARLYVDSPLFTELPAAGYVVAAVSQPGYGRSDGPPDFCGPVSQAAVRRAVEAVRALPEVRAGGVVLYGHSRGAITASMVALHDPGLAGVVLGGGVYDMAAAYEVLPEGSGIRTNIEAETGGTAAAFVQRSALLAEGVSTVPTLILHGEDDPIAPVEGARRLTERLRTAGTPVELVIFPELGHRLPWEEKKPAVLRFLQRVTGVADPAIDAGAAEGAGAQHPGPRDRPSTGPGRASDPEPPRSLAPRQVAGELNRAGFRDRSGNPWTQLSTFHLLPRLIEVAPAVRTSALFRELPRTALG